MESATTKLQGYLRDLGRSSEQQWLLRSVFGSLLIPCFYLQSNAIVVGIEFSLPGNLLGIQAFCKEFGYYSETEGKYQVSGILT